MYLYFIWSIVDLCLKFIFRIRIILYRIIVENSVKGKAQFAVCDDSMR